MSELREDLDRALRTVTFGEAPVERAKRDGRRIRIRRRVALLAGALAVAAVAAGYPALARSGAAAPAPANGQPTRTSPAGHDPVITDTPPGQTTEAPGGLTDKSGIVAAGTMGGARWQVAVDGPNAANPVPADSCYTVTISPLSGVISGCGDLPSLLSSGLGSSVPARFTGMSEGTTEVTVGVVTQNLAYFIVTFHDGQQLKLIPVTAGGHRYIAWAAPLSMTIDTVVAHLGDAYSDSGQVAVAVPFDLPGQMPFFGLWQLDGQSAPPPDAKVIGSGTTDGHAWKTSAYEGPWGTCFVTSPEDFECVPVEHLGGTAVLGGWGGSPPGPAGFGSAAPGVASVRVTLSDGKTVRVRPVGVGNEALFAFAIGDNATPTHWTAYDSSGQQVGAGSVTSGSAVKPGRP